MKLTTNNWFNFSWPKIRDSVFESKTDQPVSKTDARVGSLMQEMVDREQGLAKIALKDISRRYPVAVIGGGALNVTVLALEGTSVFVKCGVIAELLVGVGLLGGLFNLREGVLAIEEGLRAWESNDKKLATRLLLQGALEVALGGTMILMSVARLLAITAITAAFAANPYILPALFFCLALFLLAEVLHRLEPVVNGTDLGTQLELPKLRSILKKEDPVEAMKKATEWVRSKIPECFDDPSKTSKEAVHNALKKYKAEIGFTAGTEACRLFEMILKKKEKEEILKQIEKVEAKIADWNWTLYLKLFTVILAAVGFTAGMTALSLDSSTIDGVQSLVMAASGAVPLYLDIDRPFEREIPIVINSPLEDVPKAEKRSLDSITPPTHSIN